MVVDGGGGGMTRRQILKNEVKRITNVLIKKYRPQKIILFGSLVRPKVHQWSDIDLVVVKKTKKRIYDRIGEVVSLCDPEVAVDFIVYTPEEFEKMGKEEPFVYNEVVENGKILYEKSH